MPRWTSEEYELYLARTKACGSRYGAGPVVQERQANHGQKSGDAAQNQTVDDEVHPRFRVSILLRVSDHRRRDADGAVSTLLDCLVSAVGRLLAMDSRNQRQGDSGRKRVRRGHDHH